jgi:hypothetical protein
MRLGLSPNYSEHAVCFVLTRSATELGSPGPNAGETCMLNVGSSMEALVVQWPAMALRAFAEGGFHGISSDASASVCTSRV